MSRAREVTLIDFAAPLACAYAERKIRRVATAPKRLNGKDFAPAFAPRVVVIVEERVLGEIAPLLISASMRPCAENAALLDNARKARVIGKISRSNRTRTLGQLVRKRLRFVRFVCVR